jgi:Holliday junction DNA helicase RuvA
MIGWLRGRVVGRPQGGRVILDVGGVGYELLASVQTLAELPEAGDAAVELWVHTHLREQALELFGFGTRTERRMFELLISVSGVGPRGAIGILSGLAVADLVAAIAGSDHGTLQKIPGVGKKTAERIVIDLADKVGELGLAGDSRPKPATAAAPAEDEELKAALVALGWKPKEVELAVARLAEHDGAAGGAGPASPSAGAAPRETIDQRVRRALRLLMGPAERGAVKRGPAPPRG